MTAASELAYPVFMQLTKPKTNLRVAYVSVKDGETGKTLSLPVYNASADDVVAAIKIAITSNGKPKRKG